MIILITGNFPVYDHQGYATGKTEFVVSHGIDVETGKTVILPNDHPRTLGGKFDYDIGEWVIYDSDT
jgi:hypothetical protein